MFKPKANERYMMPAMFGPMLSGGGSERWYRDVRMLVVSYVTDAERLAALLPASFRPAELPVITVNYARNRNIDWLAGRAYNLIGVSAAVEFEGEKDILSGSFTLAMWENLTDPILTGRELQGIPKLFADIPDHSEENGVWKVGASHYESPIVSLTGRNFQAVSQQDIADHAESQKDKQQPMGWRYLPAIGGLGEPVSQFTNFPSEVVTDEAWVGEGEICWKELTWEQNPTQFHIVNALGELPILEMLPALGTQGSANLVVPDRPSRVIR